MVTGASHAEAALLVIDAKEGVQENSRRHGYMLSMLGISQIAVLVNKMDLVGYDRAVFERIRAEYGAFLAEIDVRPQAFLPLSGDGGRQRREREGPAHLVRRPERARGLGRLRGGPAARGPAVPHARAGRLQVHERRRRPPDRGGDGRDGPPSARRRGRLLSLREAEPRPLDRELRPRRRRAGRGGRGHGVHPHRADLRDARRARREGGRGPPGRQHEASREPLLARARADGGGEGVRPPPRDREGAHAPRVDRTRPRRFEPRAKTRRSSGSTGTRSRRSCSGRGGRWRSTRPTSSP